MQKEEQDKILQSVEFRKLVKTRWNISLIFTFLMLFIYIGFLLLVAYKKDFLKTQIGENLNFAIFVGLGLIVFSWLITGLYVYWANNYYDVEVGKIKKNR